MIKRGILVMSVALAVVAAAGSQESAIGYLFVSSDPLGASIVLDGVALEKRTPALLVGVAPGKHSLRLEKPGWIAAELAFQAPATERLSAGLTPAYPVLRFQDQAAVFVNGSPVDDPEGGLRFSPGVLAFEPTPDGLSVRPVYGGQWLLDGVRLALPLFLGLTGALTAREIVEPRESRFPIAPELAVSALLGGGLLAADIALEVRKKAFLDAYGAVPVDPGRGSAAAAARYEAAGAAMDRGDSGSALALYEALAADYPDSPLVPAAVFETGRLRFMRGDIAGAGAAFLSVVEEYPVIGLYDRALKSLADCRLAEGDAAGALKLLDRMTFLGPGLGREDVELYRGLIAEPQPSP